MKTRLGGLAKPEQTLTWRPGNPDEAGYYLAAWVLQSKQRVCSELWYNSSTNTWWAGRGYLECFGDVGPFLKEPIPGVYAYAEIPKTPDPSYFHGPQDEY